MRNDVPSSPAASLAPPVSGFSPWLMGLALFLVGINLRPALSSVAPLLAAMRAGTGLSSTGVSLLTTLPVLCFGAFAPLSPLLAGRFGAERVVLASLLLLTMAIGARVFFGVAGLFVGTLFAGATIGVIMVLLPGIIKRDFPRRTGGMMGMYTMALCLGAALAAGLSVPIQQWAGGNWRVALAFWLLPVLAAVVVWWRATRHTALHGAGPRYRVRGLWTDAVAWQVTGFLGLQSALAYCVFGWLPTILIDRGLSPLAAGAMLSLSITLQLTTALAGPWIAGLGRDQRAAVLATILLTLLGFLGCMIAEPDMLWLWSAVLGLGQGGSFSVGLTLIVLRTPNAALASSLSGMAQGVGYTAAALGPLILGLLHDRYHNWHAATVFFVLVGLAACIPGFYAGRSRYVGAVSAPLAEHR